VRNPLCIILFVALSFLSSPGLVFPEPHLVMNTSNNPPNSTEQFDGIGDLVLKEAFSRLGIRLKTIRLPSERALVNANAGIEDGNYARVAGLSATYPNLIQVPESITHFEFVAISKNLNVPTRNWASLKPYNVGIITGWKILEQNIVGTKNLIRVTDHHALFQLLQLDRVDCVVYDYHQALFEAMHEQIGPLVYMKPPLASRDMYLYLHRKHETLVPRLAEAIRSMKKDGTYDAIVKQAMDALLKKP
jgi:polar amino acid transport system substrate-binding protein